MTISARLWRRYYHARNVVGGVTHLLLDQMLWSNKKRTGR